MILANVNIGTGPSAGDGDPLRTAFTIINNNFQTITNNVNSLTNSVNTVAGRTGNVILTVNDIVGLTTNYAVNGNVTAANLGMRGYVDSKITANIALLVNAAPSTLDTIRELADAIGDDPNFAVNIALSVSTANTQMRGYVDGQITAANTASSTANVGMTGYVNQANTTMKSYVDGQITAANAGVTSANLGMKGYVDSVAGGSYSNVNVTSFLPTYTGNIAANISKAGKTWTFDSYGNITLPGGATLGITATNTAILTAATSNTVDIQSSNRSNKLQIDDTMVSIITGDSHWHYDLNGKLTLPSGANITSYGAGVTTIFDDNGVAIAQQVGVNAFSVTSSTGVRAIAGGNIWQFGTDGNLTVPGSIIPSANVTYSLGTITSQWKDLFVSNNTIFIGGTPLSVINGQLSVGGNSISISWSALENKTGANGPATIALGRNSGGGIQGASSIAIGDEAGGANQGSDAVAVGLQAGKLSQGNNASAFGYAAGRDSQGDYTTAIGGNAGETAQGDYAVAIGTAAGNDTQGMNAIAIGYGAGNDVQKPNAVAIGYNAGYTNQNANAIAIGSYSGYLNQNEKSIIINASGNILNSNTQGLYINPVRQDDSNIANVVYYNTSTKEMTYGPAAGSLYSNVQVEVFTNLSTYAYSANVTAANVGMQGYVDNAVLTANIGMKGYVDNAVATSGYSNVQVATYLPTHTGNVAAGNVKVSTAYRFETGNVTITNESGYVSLNPDTAYSGTAGVKIGGSGFILGPNGARNLTLNYNSVSGAVGLQGNVTIGSAGSGNLFVLGNVIARDITGGNILATGTSGVVGFNSGGFVQQATSNATQVTSNTTSGNIQLMSIDIGAHAVHTVTFACNKLTTNDLLLVKHISGGLTSVYVDAYVASDGLAVIWLRDITGSGTGAFTPMLKYAIVRAPSA